MSNDRNRDVARAGRGTRWGTFTGLAVLILVMLALTYIFGKYAGVGTTSVDVPITTGQGPNLLGAPSGATGPRR